jgi:hypothetical protein
MKKIFFTLALILVASTMFTSCMSSAQKKEAADENVQEAKQDLKDAQSEANVEAQKAANAEEWRIFKEESEARVRANELAITELKQKLKSSGKKLDEMHARNIDDLEQRNREMKIRIVSYEKSQNGWETFKREFTHDINEIGDALKDVTVKNTK